MRIGSLFTGARGLDMAAEGVLGGEVAWCSEIDPAACQVLGLRSPGVANLGDIGTVDWSRVEPVDVLVGGFPCQSVSSAGSREGLAEGTRTGLWLEMAEAVRALRPRLVLAENVAGLLSLGLDRVVADLLGAGYAVRWGVVRASDVGACHQRARVWIAAELEGWIDPPPVPWARLEPGGWASGVDGLFGSCPLSSSWPAWGAACAGMAWMAPDPVQAESEASTALLPTPSAQESEPTEEWLREFVAAGGATEHQRIQLPGREWFSQRTLSRVVAGLRLLPTPIASDSRQGAVAEVGGDGRERSWGTLTNVVKRGSWAQYGPAVERHAGLVGRPAPAPTVPGPKGPRLNPAFSEWMMGWPEGWVSEMDLPAVAKLRLCGNGVMPQQAAAAYRLLLPDLAISSSNA